MRFLIVAVSLFSSTVHAGFSVRGGGDEVALEFWQAYARAVDEIQDRQPEVARKIRGLNLEDVSEDVKVLIVDQPLLAAVDGGEQESVALNEPSTLRIWIDRARWRAITSPRLR